MSHPSRDHLVWLPTGVASTVSPEFRKKKSLPQEWLSLSCKRGVPRLSSQGAKSALEKVGRLSYKDIQRVFYKVLQECENRSIVNSRMPLQEFHVKWVIPRVSYQDCFTCFTRSVTQRLSCQESHTKSVIKEFSEEYHTQCALREFHCKIFMPRVS